MSGVLWNKEEIKILTENYSNYSVYELKNMLPNRTESQIRNKVNRLNLHKRAILNGLSQNDLYKNNYNNSRKYYKKYGLYLDIKLGFSTYVPIEWWKFTYYGTPNGKKMKQIPYKILADKPIVDEIFKYVIIYEMKKDTRDKLLSISKSDFEQYILSGMLYKFYNSIYDLLVYLFPEYNIKPWELTVTISNYWNNKDNADEYMRWFIKEKLMMENINNFKYEIPKIFTVSELRKINEHTLNHIFHVKKYYKSYFEWLNFLYPDLGLKSEDFAECISKDGKKLNSMEELKTYEFIKYEMGINIIPTYSNRKNNMYFDSEENANYIPDFIIPHLTDKKIIIEYFGLYKDNINHPFIKNYIEKAKNKIKYFQNNNEVYFIDLYPTDLNNNFEGVKRKIINLIKANEQRVKNKK